MCKLGGCEGHGAVPISVLVIRFQSWKFGHRPMSRSYVHHEYAIPLWAAATSYVLPHGLQLLTFLLSTL